MFGAAKVTLTPETVLPSESVAVATSLLVKAALTVADWLAPEVAVSAAAAPALTVKLAEVPVIRPWVAASVVVCASVSVIEAVPTPLRKLNEDPVVQLPAAG